MKKLLALILVCLFCLPCAFAEADVDVLIANGKYDEAIAALNAEKAQIEAQIAEVEALKAAEPSGKTSVEVPITAENWDEYFEVVYWVETDPFGNLEIILPEMCLREEYAFRIDSSQEMNIALAFDYSGAAYFIDSFDAENHTFEVGKKVRDDNETYNGYQTFTTPRLKKQANRFTNGSDWIVSESLPIMPGTEEDGRKAYGIAEYTVTNAQGSLFLFEE